MKHKISIFFIIFSIFFSKIIYAQTMFVNDVTSISLRAYPGSMSKIISVIKSGQKVEILEQRGDWSKVKNQNPNTTNDSNSNNKEGWVQTRFLTDEEPNALILENLQKKYSVLAVQVDSLNQEKNNLLEQNKKLTAELSLTKETLDKLNKSYEMLKTDSSNVLMIKSNYNKTAKDLSDATNKVNLLSSELNSAITDKSIMWFLSGAAVLLIGVFLGRAIRKKSNRGSSLLG